MSALVLKAPAKVNWFLRVLRQRADGYHDIQSLVQQVTLADTLSFEEASGLEVLADAPIPTEENLVYRAASLLRAYTRCARGARITLSKDIPLSAGLGGGSSDAAAALKGLTALWQVEVTAPELAMLAASLGSDVPFFLGSPAALVEGRGERVGAVRVRRSWVLVLVKPDFGVSAGWAYQNLTSCSAATDPEEAVRDLERGEFVSPEVFANDLEGPVFKRYAEVSRLKERLGEEGALLTLMSGSGPTVFGVFSDRARAERAAAGFAPLWSAVVRTVL
ncbi:MAG: 4-(cytidine 5'-diphospho)-2-C-methyl-D-erythritol kinase [Nitrospirota bacterium]